MIVMATFNHESAVSSTFLRNILRFLHGCDFIASLRQTMLQMIVGATLMCQFAGRESEHLGSFESFAQWIVGLSFSGTRVRQNHK
jgi:hypothetical protein